MTHPVFVSRWDDASDAYDTQSIQQRTIHNAVNALNVMRRSEGEDAIMKPGTPILWIRSHKKRDVIRIDDEKEWH